MFESTGKLGERLSGDIERCKIYIHIYTQCIGYVQLALSFSAVVYRQKPRIRVTRFPLSYYLPLYEVCVQDSCVFLDFLIIKQRQLQTVHLHELHLYCNNHVTRSHTNQLPCFSREEEDLGEDCCKDCFFRRSLHHDTQTHTFFLLMPGDSAYAAHVFSSVLRNAYTKTDIHNNDKSYMKSASLLIFMFLNGLGMDSWSLPLSYWTGNVVHTPHSCKYAWQ